MREAGEWHRKAEVCVCKARKTKYGKGWLGRQMFIQRERWPGGRRDERKMCNVCVSQERLPLSQAPVCGRGWILPRDNNKKRSRAWKSLELFSAHKLPLFVTACFISREG